MLMIVNGVEVRPDNVAEAIEFMKAWEREGALKTNPAASASYGFRVTGVDKHGNEVPYPATSAAVFPRVPAPSKPKPRGTMTPTGKTKKCRSCKRDFPILTRADCSAVRCQACAGRPVAPAVPVSAKPVQKPASKPAAPTKRTPDLASAKGLLARPPIKPSEATQTCRACGDKTRVSGLDGEGRCKDCQPIGAAK